MPDLGHALNRCAIASALQPWHFNLQAQELNALRAVVNPLAAAFKVVRNTTQEVFRDPRQFGFFDLVRQVVKPPFGLALNVFGIFNRLAVQ